MFYDPNEQPACPAVRVVITDNISGVKFGPFDALVDTGADTTCVPRRITNGIPNLAYSYHRVDFGDGSSATNKFVSVADATVEFLDKNDAVLLRGQYDDLLLQTVESGYLGRDILNYHICEFDGPNLRCLIK